MAEYETTVKKVVPAARERVFDAWLDPKALARFMTPGPEMTVPKAESDGRVGGSFLILMKSGDKEIPHTGEYRVVDRPHKLAFTWSSPFVKAPGLVTLDFAEHGDGHTEVTLRHTGLESEESRDNHRGGWTAILEALGAATG